MKALRLIDWKTDPEMVEVPKPTPGPGGGNHQIGGAGVCHSDLHVMHDFRGPAWLPWKIAIHVGPRETPDGVDSVGDRVTAGCRRGDAVAVYGAWGCGKCKPMPAGASRNYCENPAEAAGRERRRAASASTVGWPKYPACAPPSGCSLPLPDGLGPRHGGAAHRWPASPPLPRHPPVHGRR